MEKTQVFNVFKRIHDRVGILIYGETDKGPTRRGKGKFNVSRTCVIVTYKSKKDLCKMRFELHNHTDIYPDRSVVGIKAAVAT